MRRRELLKTLPPGPRLPAALQLLATWKRPAASPERLRRRYGKRITVRLPFQPPLVLLSDPEEIRELFTAPPEVLHPGEGARVLEPIVGRKSVILLDESAHLEQRKLLLPAFHGERMQRLNGLMTDLAEREVASWPRGRAIELHPRLQRLTLEIILRAVFGLEQGQQLDALRELLTQLLAFSENPLSLLPAAQRLERWLPTVQRFNRLIERTDRLIFELVDERRADPAAGADGSDVLAMLLAARRDDGSPMRDQEIRDELMTALVAGHETTASQLAWAFERLSREPIALSRLVEELVDGEGDEYLTATIHEVLRLRPVLPNAEPRLTMRPVEIGGFRYPAGVLLVASAFLVHRDPEIYPEPYAFRPERFVGGPQQDDPGAAQSGNGTTRARPEQARQDAERAASSSGCRAGGKPGTYTWLPFGGGRRRCLGASFALQEMKVVIRALLTRCEITPAVIAPEATRRRSITLSPARGATVVVRDRERLHVRAPALAAVA
jgi:cytochrome P450